MHSSLGWEFVVLYLILGKVYRFIVSNPQVFRIKFWTLQNA